MTKPRPSWSESGLRAAAFAGSLLFVLQAPPVLAAKAHAVVRPSVVARALPEAETGPAEILDTDLPGLHGRASFYGAGFEGRRTSTGERFDSRQLTAASNHFPLGSRVAVRRLDTGQCAIVRINDRMHAGHRRRVIDVSRAVAEHLGMLRAGVVLVRVAPLRGGGREQGAAACLAAFEVEPACIACGQPPSWPVFDD